MRDIFQFMRLCGLLAVVGLVKAEDVKVALTAAEQAWVHDHPVVRFGYDPAWPPFSYRDGAGAIAGIDREILDRLSVRLGVKFAPVDSRSWPEAYENAKNGGADFLVSTVSTDERAGFFIFSRPYASFPMAIIARMESPALRSLDQLDGKTVAAARDYVGMEALRRDYPRINIEIFDTLDLAFLAVSQGRADAVATNIPNASYIIRSLGLANLKVAGVMPYLFPLSYAVRRDEPMLLEIMNKGVDSLGVRERQEIIAPWVKLDYENIVRWDYVMHRGIALGVAAALILGLILWRHLSLRSELEKRLRIQRELEAARAHLEQLNEEKSGLMRMAAHDLRNPLTGIIMNLDMVRLGVCSGNLTSEPFERIDHLVGQMTHMIRNLLDVEALEDGSRRLKIEPLGLAAAVQETLAVLKPVAEQKKILLRMEAPKVVVGALADRAALHQIIDNLVSNALKYSSSQKDVVVTVAEPREGRVCLRVRDEGPGIKPEERPRLFHKYTCLSARPTGGEPSTGLGLAIVKQLVTAMNGRVWFDPPAGGGACFVVELPAAVMI